MGKSVQKVSLDIDTKRVVEAIIKLLESQQEQIDCLLSIVDTHQKVLEAMLGEKVKEIMGMIPKVDSDEKEGE